MKKNLLKTLILSILCVFVMGASVEAFADIIVPQSQLVRKRLDKTRTFEQLSAEEKARLTELQQIEKEQLALAEDYLKKAKEFEAQIPSFEEKAKIAHEKGKTSEEAQIKVKIEDIQINVLMNNRLAEEAKATADMAKRKAKELFD